jgi:hypothetical protein
VSVEELIGEQPSATARKRGRAPKLEQQLQRISELPKPRQRAVMDVIEAMLAQPGRWPKRRAASAALVLRLSS